MQPCIWLVSSYQSKKHSEQVHKGCALESATIENRSISTEDHTSVPAQPQVTGTIKDSEETVERTSDCWSCRVYGSTVEYARL